MFSEVPGRFLKSAEVVEIIEQLLSIKMFGAFRMSFEVLWSLLRGWWSLLQLLFWKEIFAKQMVHFLLISTFLQFDDQPSVQPCSRLISFLRATGASVQPFKAASGFSALSFLIKDVMEASPGTPSLKGK
jgi:hypothetical protein